ncbi:MAG: GDSL-type esterase/lipase family protein [Rhodospirillaceae bacterium]
MRICFIGDSFVNGTGDDDCLGWTGRLCASARQQGCDLTHYNLGIRRDSSAEILRRWKGEAELRLPLEMDGRLVFSFGANDCNDSERGGARIMHEKAVENAKAILADAAQWKPTLMVGPLPFLGNREIDARIAALSEAMELHCQELNVPFFGFRALDNKVGEIWRREAEAGDGSHPDRGGYSALAEAISGWASWKEWTAA